MATTAVSCLLLVLSVYGYLGYFPPLSASGTLAAPSSSWNPGVTCSPMVVTVEQVLGTQANSMGGATENGSMFNPGITSPLGSAKRWLTPGPTPSGWVSPGPPCTITNASGQVTSAFVEIHRIQRNYLYNEDYAVQYDPVNGGSAYPTGMNLSDTTFNAFTPGYATCTSTNTTGCMHTIHMEFDHDWKAAGYCGPNTACDPHAMAPATPAEPQPNSSGPTPTVAMNPSTIAVAASGTANSTLTATTASSDTGDYAVTVTGRSGNLTRSTVLSVHIVDFSIIANPTSLTIPIASSSQSTLTLASINGFSGNLGLAASVTPTSVTAGLSPSDPTTSLSASNLALSAGGSGTVTLTISASLLTTPGTYAVTVSATSGGVTHTAVVSIIVNMV